MKYISSWDLHGFLFQIFQSVLIPSQLVNSYYGST